MSNIAIFASGNGSNAEAIIKYFAEDSQDHVVLLLSNRRGAYALQRAANHGIESFVFDRQMLYDNTAELVAVLESHKVDLIVLAGFMMLMSTPIIELYRNRIVNIHPALLPKFGGKGMYGDHVHRAVIAACECESGITIHHVTEQYDDGATIFQARCPVAKDDTAESLAARIHTLEHEHYPRIIKQLL